MKIELLKKRVAQSLGVRVGLTLKVLESRLDLNLSVT